MSYDAPVMIGGLYRCCIETIRIDMKAEHTTVPEEGKRLKCICGGVAMYHHHAWMWDKEDGGRG